MEGTTARIIDEPLRALGYGVVFSVAAMVVFALLVFSAIGIVIAIPLLVVIIVVGELGYLAAGRRVTDGWGPALLVAMVAAAFAGGVPILGGLVGFLLTSLGFGGEYLDYQDRDQYRSRSSVEPR